MHDLPVKLGRWGVALLAVAVLGACGDDDQSASTTAVTTAATAGAATTLPSTTPPPSTETAATETTETQDTETETSATEACGDAFTSTEPVTDGYPQRMSGLVGHDIRTGAHPCFERVVLELEGTGELPGYRVEYVDDPVLLSPSDQTVDIAGDATLVLSVASWMTSMEGDGYDGPTDITPTNVEHVLQLRMIENFEGLSAWAIGLDEQRPFVVSVLDDPPRIVIDIATTPEAP
jgi:hypothetical protein